MRKSLDTSVRFQNLGRRFADLERQVAKELDKLRPEHDLGRGSSVFPQPYGALRDVHLLACFLLGKPQIHAALLEMVTQSLELGRIIGSARLRGLERDIAERQRRYVYTASRPAL